MPSDQGFSRAPRRRAVTVAVATALLAVATLLFSLRPLQIALPDFSDDEPWPLVLGEAAMRPARWGIDLMFTYGPASALITRYFTENYLTLSLPIVCGMALVFALCFTCLTLRAVEPYRHSVPLTVVAVAGEALALFLAGADIQDAFYFAFALVVFLLDLGRPSRDRLSLLAVLAGAGALGALTMSKTSFGILAFLLLVLSDASAMMAGRRYPLPTPIFAVAVVAAYLIYGQHLADLPAYLRLQGDSVAGYGEAMSIVGGRAELLTFLGGAAALVGVTLLGGPRGPMRRLFAVIGVGLVLEIALKAGFVRADQHQQIAWAALGLSGVAVAVAVVLPRSLAAAAAVGAASLLVLLVVAPLFSFIDTERPIGGAGFADLYAADLGGAQREAAAWGRLVRDPGRFAAQARADKLAGWAEIRAHHPLPDLPGTVDVISSEQSTILGNGLDYHPRPSFQDYATYTPALIEANLAFYRGASAPDWVLVASDPIDERYPTSIEGALWPELLARYAPDRRVADWLVLHRRPTALTDVLGASDTFDVALGQPFKVPPGSVFARIVVRKTLLGRLAAALFRPPALNLRVKLSDGGERTYRFIPALGAEGFVLSPLVDDAASLALFFAGHGDDLDEKAVSEVSVTGSSGVRLFYEPRMAVALQPLIVQPIGPNPQIDAALADVTRRRRWLRLARQLDPSGSLDGDRLSVPAPRALTVPTAGSARLRLGFGVEDGAWTTGRTEGVCFAVLASPDASQPLWRRCLDPLAATADRGPQTATVDLPAGSAAVTVATTCRKSCDWGWSYLDDIDPEP